MKGLPYLPLVDVSSLMNGWPYHPLVDVSSLDERVAVSSLDGCIISRWPHHI